MKKKDTFADKLAAGTAEASAIAAWWPQHNCGLSEYLKVAADTSSRKAPADHLVALAKEWDLRLNDLEDLMLVHSRLEIVLINGAAAADSNAIDKALVALDDNIRDQVQMLRALQNGFPSSTCSSLMRDHVRYLIEAIGYWMDGNTRKLTVCKAKRGHNAASLGMLFTEWV